MKTITLDEIDRYIEETNVDESAFVRPASSYFEEVKERFFGSNTAKKCALLPWGKAGGNFDLRPYETTLWLGYNGHGKSLVLGQIANRLMMQGEGVCIASFEMRPAVTIQRMCRQAAGVKNVSLPYISAYHKWTDGKLWMYDQHGTTPPNRVASLCKYVTSIGVTHIIIDSLMKVIPKEDDYNGQKQFVDQLCVIARDTGLHIHLIHHSRKGSDESNIPGKMDAKGSGAVTDLVDNCVSVWRRKDTLADKPDCLLTIDKQRHGEWEGKIALWFHAESQSFCETDQRRVIGLNLDLEEEYKHDF